MKKSQIYSMIVLVWLLLLMGSTFTQAATPNYVGIQANDTFEWSTTYDEDPLEDFYEDLEEAGEISGAQLEYLEEALDVQEDLVKAKIVILDVNDEETEPWGEEGVKITYNYYLMEEDEEYELEKQDETFGIWKYDDDIYGDDHNFATDEDYPFIQNTFHFFEFNWDDDQNDPNPEEHEIWKFIEGENPWFISTKVDWGEVVEELEDEYEDDLDYDDVSIRREKDANKLYITLDEDEDDEVEAEKWIVEYDDNGVLMHYEWQYDGDPIVIVQTQVSQIREFISDNMIWIIIGAIGIVAVIIVIIVLIKRR